MISFLIVFFFTFWLAYCMYWNFNYSFLTLFVCVCVCFFFVCVFCEFFFISCNIEHGYTIHKKIFLEACVYPCKRVALRCDRVSSLEIMMFVHEKTDADQQHTNTRFHSTQAFDILPVFKKIEKQKSAIKFVFTVLRRFCLFYWFKTLKCMYTVPGSYCSTSAFFSCICIWIVSTLWGGISVLVTWRCLPRETVTSEPFSFHAILRGRQSQKLLLVC